MNTKCLNVKFVIYSTFGLWILALSLPSTVHSAEFRTSYDVAYNVTASGTTHVSQNITLTNLTPDHYATDLTLSLDATKVSNVAATASDGGYLTSDVRYDGVTVKFDDALIGQGRARELRIEYDSDTIAQKIGRVWEINLPAFQSSSENTELGDYTVTVNVPEDFGPLHYAVPTDLQDSRAAAQQVRSFTLEAQPSQPITLTFGDYQVYDFELKYHLTSPASAGAAARQVIALPPNFKPYQEIYVRSLNPLPEKIEIDADGNVLAYYEVDAGKAVDITYTGQIRIDASRRDAINRVSTNTTAYTIPDRFWESNDPQIQQLAAELQTPRAIYDYVTQNLTYDETRIGEDIQRFGAVQALQDKDNAVCMEFTDLTIALMRAAGISAREVDGFAYVEPLQENSSPARPTVSDVLHAWVIYFDETSQRWQQIDPTWGSTTNRDYFATLDTNHIIFVIKGINSESPHPASEDVKIKPATAIIPDVVPFDTWLADFQYQSLPWWNRLLLWLQNLLNNS